MQTTYEFQPTLIQTPRGLSIAGTRITIYQIMDYVKANQPADVIRDHFRLTVKQTEEVLAYIDQHYAEVDAAYQRVLVQADENRRYWQQRNAQRFADIAAHPRDPAHDAIWQKLDAIKHKAA
jgi:uncharacterized protein (DUF433 family)